MKFVTIFTSAEGFGWQEVHYLQAGSENPNLGTALDNFLATVVPARVQLCGEDISIVGARVSYPRAGAIASTAKRQQFTGLPNVASSDWGSSLAVIFKNADFTKSKVVHLRGFWDLVAQDESYHPELGPGWEDRLVAWKGTLVDGNYGWLTKDPATSVAGDVTGYVVGADNRVTFTLAAPGIAAPPPVPRITVRFSRFHNSKSVLNRSLQVEYVNATTLKTIKRIGADPASSTGHFNYRALTFVRYNNTASISLGKRAPGRPLNRPPGRQSAQVLI